MSKPRPYLRDNVFYTDLPKTRSSFKTSINSSLELEKFKDINEDLYIVFNEDLIYQTAHWNFPPSSSLDLVGLFTQYRGQMGKGERWKVCEMETCQ